MTPPVVDEDPPTILLHLVSHQLEDDMSSLWNHVIADLPKAVRGRASERSESAKSFGEGFADGTENFLRKQIALVVCQLQQDLDHMHQTAAMWGGNIDLRVGQKRHRMRQLVSLPRDSSVLLDFFGLLVVSLVSVLSALPLAWSSSSSFPWIACVSRCSAR
jgi:hypothetical protein